MNKDYKRHSSVVVQNKCSTVYEQEYNVLYESSQYQRIISVPAKTGTDVPYGSQFLAAETKVTPNGVIPVNFFFLEEVPVPRTLPVLDLQAEVWLNNKLSIATIYKDLGEPLDIKEWKASLELYVKNIVNQIFQTEREAAWWWSKRNLVLDSNWMTSAYRLTISITENRGA